MKRFRIGAKLKIVNDEGETLTGTLLYLLDIGQPVGNILFEGQSRPDWQARLKLIGGRFKHHVYFLDSFEGKPLVVHELGAVSIAEIA